MSLAALLAFLEAHGTVILGLWLVLEQYLAENKKLEANSTFQLIRRLVRLALAKYVQKKNG